MKKICLALIFLVAMVVSTNAQCVIDVNNNNLGVSPPDSVFPVILTGQALDNSYVAQVYVPTQANLQGINATVYYVAIFSISGLPSGITYTRNPNQDTIFGGNNACIQLEGTTTDPTGEYPLTFTGVVKVNTNFTGDTVIPLAILNLLAAQSGTPGFGYKLKVVDPNGINDISDELSAAMQVMPNPSNGRFDVKLNYFERMEGTLTVLDVTGKSVYSEQVNSNGPYNASINLSNVTRGMYVVQLKTATGIASKKLTIE